MSRLTDAGRPRPEQRSQRTGQVRADRQVAVAWALLLAGLTATVLVTPAVAFVVTLVPFLGLLAVSGDAQATSTDRRDG